MIFDGLQSLGRIGIGVATMRCGLDGLTSPPCLLADLNSMSVYAMILELFAQRTILYMGTEPYVIATKPTMTLKT